MGTMIAMLLALFIVATTSGSALGQTIKIQLKAKKPEVLVASSYFEEALLIVRQSKQLKFCPKMLALTIGPEIPEFVKSLGKDADHIYGSAWWLPDAGWEGRDFGSSRDYARAMLKRTGREPSYPEAAGTVAGLFLQMAIEKANSLDTDAVRGAFRTIDVETFWGPVAWKDKGQNIKGVSVPIQIQNGRVVSSSALFMKGSPEPGSDGWRRERGAPPRGA